MSPMETMTCGRKEFFCVFLFPLGSGLSSRPGHLLGQ